ncbi:MAG: hypothetical protein JO198_12780 [Candidatus Dormibacteraeota bacterium]|nr:hypothetical protein [Candidatus Dormibacteraeota bacterium]
MNAAASAPSLGRRLDFRAVDEAGFVALPPIDRGDADDEEQQAAKLEQASYEVPAWEWRPIASGGVPTRPPTRFIDGTLHSRTFGVIRANGALRPLILASIAAAELRLEGRTLRRPEDGWRNDCVLCIAVDIGTDLTLELKEAASACGVRLVARESEAAAHDFELSRRRAWDFAKREMEALERALLLRDPETPALADGLLERRLVTIESQRQAAVGMVKQVLRHYLPAPLTSLLYELSPGERTPAFLLQTTNAHLVSWYLRLGEGAMMGPGQGIVRLSMPLEYLERAFPAADDRSREISAISHRLRQLRCRQESYGRSAVSLEPIVTTEEVLRTLVPPLEQRAAALRRALN